MVSPAGLSLSGLYRKASPAPSQIFLDPTSCGCNGGQTGTGKLLWTIYLSSRIRGVGPSMGIKRGTMQHLVEISKKPDWMGACNSQAVAEILDARWRKGGLWRERNTLL